MNKFLKEAYKEALKSKELNEVPVGAVIVMNNKIISRAHNTKENANDISAHAEIIALRKASKKLGTYILKDCDIYVTLEPCIMCASAIQQSKINKVYFGAKEPKTGGIVSLFHTLDIQGLNHYPKYEFLDDKECASILKDFFQNKR